jgi:hypothetical protein
MSSFDGDGRSDTPPDPFIIVFQCDPPSSAVPRLDGNRDASRVTAMLRSGIVYRYA